MKNKDNDIFDRFVYWICKQIPRLGPWIGKYYMNHSWFQRLAKFGTSTLIVFWLVKAPLIWSLDLILGDINLIFFVIPGYIPSAFIAGLMVTLVGFVLNEVWVWGKIS